MQTHLLLSNNLMARLTNKDLERENFYQLFSLALTDASEKRVKKLSIIISQ